MAYARIFNSGDSQAVRLPKEFRFEVDRVEIFRRGDELLDTNICIDIAKHNPPAARAWPAIPRTNSQCPWSPWASCAMGPRRARPERKR